MVHRFYLEFIFGCGDKRRSTSASPTGVGDNEHSPRLLTRIPWLTDFIWNVFVLLRL